MRDCCCHPFQRQQPPLHGHIFECVELNEKFYFDFVRRPYVEKGERKILFESFDFDEARRRFTGMVKWPVPVDRAVETWFDFTFSRDYRTVEESQRKSYDENRRDINGRWRLNSVGYQLVDRSRIQPKRPVKQPYKTFDVTLASCPVVNGVPRIVVLCCEEMEKQIENCLGVYRAPGNRKIHNKLIKIMGNKKYDAENIREKLKGLVNN